MAPKRTSADEDEEGAQDTTSHKPGTKCGRCDMRCYRVIQCDYCKAWVCDYCGLDYGCEWLCLDCDDDDDGGLGASMEQKEEQKGASPWCIGTKLAGLQLARALLVELDVGRGAVQQIGDVRCRPRAKIAEAGRLPCFPLPSLATPDR